jgi:hypothetical protein
VYKYQCGSNHRTTHGTWLGNFKTTLHLCFSHLFAIYMVYAFSQPIKSYICFIEDCIAKFSSLFILNDFLYKCLLVCWYYFVMWMGIARCGLVESSCKQMLCTHMDSEKWSKVLIWTYHQPVMVCSPSYVTISFCWEPNSV